MFCNKIFFENLLSIFFSDFVENITADANDHFLHEVEQELHGTCFKINPKPEQCCQTESKSSKMEDFDSV